jgi:proteasome accessory factor B
VPADAPVTDVPVEERLFNLVLALVATENGLTKNEILSTVQGYRQRFHSSGNNASLERQFERDKDDLREQGVPLETVESPGDPGNNQTLRYRIPKGRYEIPADIRFSAEEMTLLSLAATVWREGSLSGESRRAILKLRSLGVESNEPVLGYAPRVRVREPAFAPLNSALERNQVVTFSYLKPGEAKARTRRIAPLALVQHSGRWHLYAFDLKANATRTFLLSRIVDEVSRTDASFDPASFGLGDNDFTAQALDGLEEVWRRGVADIEVVPDTDASTRLGNRYGSSESGNRFILHFTDLNILADELASYGPEVFVHAPDELRAAVIDRLKTSLATHTGPAPVAPEPLRRSRKPGGSRNGSSQAGSSQADGGKRRG